MLIKGSPINKTLRYTGTSRCGNLQTELKLWTVILAEDELINDDVFPIIDPFHNS